MNYIFIIKLSKIFSMAMFWMPITIIYFQNRTLSLSEIYQLLSIYYIAVVILEFPTGVIGDYFSHRFSTISGNIILGLALIVLSFSGNYLYYLFALLLAALGVALSSGSDTALLHTHSKNFAKDQSDIRFYATLVVFIATALGSVLYQFNISLPFLLTGVFSVLAGIILIPISNTGKGEEKGNIFSVAFRSVAHIKRNKLLSTIIFISALIGAFNFSFKWFLNPLFEQLHIPTLYWGILIALTNIVALLGIKYYQRSTTKKFSFVYLFALSLIPLAITFFPLIPIFFLFFHNIIRGYIETYLEVKINEVIEGNERASILSLNNLLIRLGASIYTPIGGIIIERSSFSTIIVLTGVFLFISIMLTVRKIVLSD